MCVCFYSINYRLLEVFSWLVEVDNITKENRDNGKIIWSVNYVQEGGRAQNFSTEMMTNSQPDGKKQKIIARFQIMKDDIQAILPIAKVGVDLYNKAVFSRVGSRYNGVSIHYCFKCQVILRSLNREHWHLSRKKNENGQLVFYF